MRRPPTRGPRDPWTPRTVSLRGHLCEPLPRRPTLDGPAHKVHLHGPYAAALRTLRETPRPAPPPTLPKLASGPTGGGHSGGNPALTPAAHVAFLFIGLAGLPAAVSPRATPCPAPPLTLPKSASGFSGTPHPAGNPHTPPRRARCFFLYRPSGPTGAAHVAFLFIGLAGLPAAVSPRSPPHPAPPTKNAALSRRVLLCMLPAAGMRRGVIRFGPSLSWRSGCGPSGCPGPSPAARRRG